MFTVGASAKVHEGSPTAVAGGEGDLLSATRQETDRRTAGDLESREADGHADVPSAHADLAPTARRLLEAARRLLERSGYRALSLEAIGREAGENKSLIWYHFGGKPGLLVALVDWLLYDVLRDLRQKVGDMRAGDERQRMVVGLSRELATDSQAYRLFYALLPHLVEDRKTRRRLAGLYTQYRAVNAKGLSLDGEDSADARALAAMLVALTDGLAIQLLIDPGSVDMDRVIRLWHVLVQSALGGSSVEPPARP